MGILKLVDYKCTNEMCQCIEEEDEYVFGQTKVCPRCGYTMEKMVSGITIQCGIRKSIFHGPKAKGRYTKYIDTHKGVIK